MSSNQKVAKIIGLFFILAIITYATGDSIINSTLKSINSTSNSFDSSSQLMIGFGAILMLLNSAIVVGIGVLIHPIITSNSKVIANFYLSFRIIESVLLCIGVVGLLLILSISNEYFKLGISDSNTLSLFIALAKKINFYSYQLAMFALGIGSTILCYNMYKSKLIPAFLSIWGLVGYSVFLIGAMVELLGYEYGLMLSTIGGLFEIFFGFWLMIKGFNSPTIS